MTGVMYGKRCDRGYVVFRLGEHLFPTFVGLIHVHIRIILCIIFLDTNESIC